MKIDELEEKILNRIRDEHHLLKEDISKCFREFRNEQQDVGGEE